MSRPSVRCRFLRDDNGATMVEFAFVVPVFLLLVLGFIQIALWMYGIAITEVAVREGCRYGVQAYHAKPLRYPGDSGAGRYAPEQQDGFRKTVARARAYARTKEILDAGPVDAPLGSPIPIVDPEIIETDIAKGQEGTRAIEVTAWVKLPVIVGFARDWLPGGLMNFIYNHKRTCRMRLERLYTY